MLSSIIYFLPSIVAVLWLLLYAFKVKTPSQRVFTLMILCCVFYFVSYAFYISPWTDYSLMVRFDSLAEGIIMLLLSLNILYLHSLGRKRVFTSYWQMLLFLPAVVSFVVSAVLYIMVGFDAAACFHRRLDELHGTLPPEYSDAIFRTYSFFNITCFRVVSLLFLLATCIDIVLLLRRDGYTLRGLWQFFFGGQPTTALRAVCTLDLLALVSILPFAFFGRTFIMSHPMLGACMSLGLAVFIHLLAYVEYISGLHDFRLYNLTHIDFATHSAPPAQPADALTDAAATMQADIPPADPDADPDAELPSDDDAFMTSSETLDPAPLRKLNDRLVESLQAGCLYRDPELSIQSLAEALGTNRTTLSTLINQTYGKPFRQLIAEYRIEAAKTYMKEHPDATQEAVAAECGFLTAQAFNAKFKQITGYSPRLWLLYQ